jgi:hypothetical protein
MALKVLSKKTDAAGVTTIVAEVNNTSLLPLASDMDVKVGLYNSPVIDENAVTFAETTVSSADLYDATAKQNKVKIVTLTVNKPDFDQTFYLSSSPVQGSETVQDVQPLNNVLPVRLVGKFKRGDVNRDGAVDSGDIMAIYSVMAGNGDAGLRSRADVNGDGAVDSGDIMTVYGIMAGN